MVKIRWSAYWGEYRVEAPSGAAYHTPELDDAEGTAAQMARKENTTVNPRVFHATDAQNEDW